MKVFTLFLLSTLFLMSFDNPLVVPSINNPTANLCFSKDNNDYEVPGVPINEKFSIVVEELVMWHSLYLKVPQEEP